MEACLWMRSYGRRVGTMNKKATGEETVSIYGMQ
jgi:hypothetical protein